MNRIEFAARVDELRAWARSRIEHCSQTVTLEAAQEAITLRAVLRILNGEPTPIPARGGRREP